MKRMKTREHVIVSVCIMLGLIDLADNQSTGSVDQSNDSSPCKSGQIDLLNKTSDYSYSALVTLKSCNQCIVDKYFYPSCLAASRLTLVGVIDNDSTTQWMFESMAQAKSIWFCRVPLKCRPKLSDGSFDRKSYLLLDPESLEPVDESAVCVAGMHSLKYTVLTSWYFAFFERGFPESPYYAFTLFPSKAVAKFELLVALLLPVQLLLLWFGLRVIRSVLHQSNSHILVYHSTLVASDMTISILSFLTTSKLSLFLSRALCYISVPMAMLFSITGGTTAPHAQLFSTLIDLVYTFTNMAQAALAADRFQAIYTPVHYASACASRRYARAAVLICAVITLFVGALEVSANKFLRAAGDQVAPSLVSAALAFDNATIVATFAVQAFCCCAVFRFVLRRKKVAAPGSLLPSLLLLGTCGVNMIDCGISIAYQISRHFYNLTAEEQALRVGAEVEALRQLAANVLFFYLQGHRHVIISLLNCLGLFVHCAVSTPYRQEALREICVPLSMAASKGRQLLRSILPRNSVMSASESDVSEDATQQRETIRTSRV